MKNVFFSILLTASLLSLTCFAVQAQEAPPAPTAPTDPHAGWFPFVISTLADEHGGSGLDLSFLNSKPAGADGFLRARGEQIVDGRGREVRLFGTNITDYAVMPPKALAPKIARRLSELGVNLVRLHYYDWAAAPQGLMNADMETVNPEKLDQMDWLIFQLKQNGIYVNLNLHVARRYPGVPDGWDKMGKVLDRLHPDLVASQKNFARQMLTHVNPYTKTAYTNEPALAAIELNNENTALALMGEHSAWDLAALPADTRAPIERLWNAWLRGKYGETAVLRAAWDGSLPATGPQLIANGDFTTPRTDGWNAEASGGASANAGVTNEAGQSFLRWNATQAGTTNYSLQLHYSGFEIRHGQPVKLQFRARAAQDRAIQVRLMNASEPWADVLSSLPLKLTPQWQNFELTGVVNNAGEVPVRLSFDALNQVGTYDIDDLSLRVEGTAALGAQVSLESGTVPLVGAKTNSKAASDFVDFLAERERQTSGELMKWVRQELGAKSLIWDTQVNYGGARGLARELAIGSDVIDIHAYPAHPSSEIPAQGGWIWSVVPRSLLGEAFDGLPSLAQWRVAGKPFMVSEFDLNAPNDHASESIPLLATMAAYQGWAGLTQYAWLNFPADYNPDSIRSPFQTAGHAGKIAFMPASALLLRQGLLRSARTRQTLDIGAQTLQTGDVSGGAMFNAFSAQGAAKTDGWRTGVAINIVPGDTVKRQKAGAPASRPSDAKVVSDTGQIEFNRATSGAETMTVNAPSLKMAFGHTGGRSFDWGETQLSVEAGTLNNYANVMVVALDGQTLAQSKRVLVTAVARVENAGMKYNAARTSVGPDWGNGPTLAEPVKFSITLPNARWSAYALDGKGRKANALPMKGPMLQVSQPNSLWYLLERE